MSTDAYPDFAFRRRAYGRAPSPPTWACYEQIPYEDDYSDSASEDNSCSEDEEDYYRAIEQQQKFRNTRSRTNNRSTSRGPRAGSPDGSADRKRVG